MDLGVMVLKIPENRIKAALTNHRSSIHDAAHDVLSKWGQQYEREQDAYNTLYKGLRRCEMNQWARKLQNLTRASEDKPRQPFSEKG